MVQTSFEITATPSGDILNIGNSVDGLFREGVLVLGQDGTTPQFQIVDTRNPTAFFTPNVTKSGPEKFACGDFAFLPQSTVVVRPDPATDELKTTGKFVCAAEKIVWEGEVFIEFDINNEIIQNTASIDIKVIGDYSPINPVWVDSKPHGLIKTISFILPLF